MPEIAAALEPRKRRGHIHGDAVAAVLGPDAEPPHGVRIALERPGAIRPHQGLVRLLPQPAVRPAARDLAREHEFFDRVASVRVAHQADAHQHAVYRRHDLHLGGNLHGYVRLDGRALVQTAVLGDDRIEGQLAAERTQPVFGR
eukprot:7010842-Prymnesium_polylepis.2